MTDRTAMPDILRVCAEPVALPIFFPKSEDEARGTYLLSGPRAGFGHFFARAAAGSADAQAVLGNIYLNGWVDGQCLPEEAEAWALQSAEKGNAYGQWVLAWAYLEQDNLGDGISALFASADQNFSPALYHLAIFHLTGTGMQKSEGLGIKTLLKAAELGHQMAIRTIDHYRSLGYFGHWARALSIALLPLVRIVRYLRLLLFSRKFDEAGLTYVRSLLVENRIRRKYGGEFLRMELETRLQDLIRNTAIHRRS